MMKTTQKELRELVRCNQAIDITHATIQEANEIRSREKWLEQIAYASGVYGCNGQLYKGHESGNLYAITTRSQAIYLF